jgi:hypothetical protein
MCSSLNADLHLVNLKPSPACICGHGFEECIHFFLECSFYNENRVILLNIKRYFSSNILIFLLNMLILAEFLISGLRLFQSRVVEGKKDFLVISTLH